MPATSSTVNATIRPNSAALSAAGHNQREHQARRQRVERDPRERPDLDVEVPGEHEPDRRHQEDGQDVVGENGEQQVHTKWSILPAMRLRTRLSLAFFVISVLPLAVVTAYSYYSSGAALRRAAETQADQMAADMGNRMSWVMADLGDRVERLWRMRVEQPAGGAKPAGATRAAGAPRGGAARLAGGTCGARRHRPTPRRCATSRRCSSPRPRRWSSGSSSPRRASTRWRQPPRRRPSRTGRRMPPEPPDGAGRRGPPPPMEPRIAGGRARGHRTREARPKAEAAATATRGGPGMRGVPVVAPGMPRIVIDFAGGDGERRRGAGDRVRGARSVPS